MDQLLIVPQKFGVVSCDLLQQLQDFFQDFDMPTRFFAKWKTAPREVPLLTEFFPRHEIFRFLCGLFNNAAKTFNRLLPAVTPDRLPWSSGPKLSESSRREVRYAVPHELS